LYHAALISQPRSDHLFTTTSQDGEIEHVPIHFFSVDTELVYWNFFLDFGPLNLGQLYRFCSKLNAKLAAKQYSNHVICFCSNKTPAKRANAMFLICAWQMLYLDRTPEQALRGFQAQDPNAMDVVIPVSAMNASSPPAVTEGNPTLLDVPPFHDASPCACTFELTILDCLRGLAKARTYGFFDFDKFDVEEYEHFEQVEVRRVVAIDTGCSRSCFLLTRLFLSFRMAI
jgi:cell division cycle 14